MFEPGRPVIAIRSESFIGRVAVEGTVAEDVFFSTSSHHPWRVLRKDASLPCPGDAAHDLRRWPWPSLPQHGAEQTL